MLRLAPALPFALLLSAAAALAQTTIGEIEAASATVSGTLSLTGGNAVVGTNAVITARDRTATLHLSRGGEVLVCSTSALHAARGAGPSRPEPLLLALDRGAVEVHMGATASDSILTPDLRFTVVTNTGQPAAGMLDLRIRVAANGDTCVENRGHTAPTLEVTEQFGTGIYQVHPTQHLLFEHGSLREVVDGESSPCGCPPPPVLSAADAGTSTDPAHAARPGAVVSGQAGAPPQSSVEAQHPFPAAESQGLTTSSAAANVPQAPPGESHAQVAATLAYGANGQSSDGTDPAGTASSARPASPPPASSATPGSAASDPPPVATTVGPPAADQPSNHAVAQAPPPPPAPPPHDLARRLGHFFRHLFGGG